MSLNLALKIYCFVRYNIQIEGISADADSRLLTSMKEQTFHISF